MNESPTIYTDLDGTLLDHETYSAEAARAVLHSLTEQGIPIVPATSKTYSEVSEFRREMGLKHAFSFAESVDIDTIYDFELAKAIFRLHPND